MNKTIASYMEDLASSAPTPGGGGTAALIGALGCALGSMVGNLTLGKKKYAGYEQDILEILEKSAALRERFLNLMQADEDAFAPLSKAYGIPKDDPQRETILENALKGAMKPPCAILNACTGLVRLLEELSEKGSRLAVSDVACGAAACRACAQAASMNILINTHLLKDRELATQKNREAVLLVREIEERCDLLTGKICTLLLTPRAGASTPFRELRGMPVVKALCAELAPRIEALKTRGIVPALAIVRVGGSPDDLSYEKGILKRFETNGAAANVHALPLETTQNALENLILSLNADSNVHGILLFRPLPKHLDEKRLAALIDPAKDVDCMSGQNLSGIFTGKKGSFPPCTPQAVVELLDHYNIDCAGKRIVIVGRSVVVGKPLSMLLLARNATVTLCHTRTKDLAAECRRADILIACAGAGKMITPEFTNPEQLIIDVGINFVDGKLCGDADYEAVAPNVSAITPVPGGVGTVTSTVILKHTVLSAENWLRQN